MKILTFVLATALLISVQSWAEDTAKEPAAEPSKDSGSEKGEHCDYHSYHHRKKVAVSCDKSKECVKGTVELAKSLKYKAGDEDTLFIIVRKPGHDSTPPLAVAKINKPKFPQKFEIGPQDVIFDDGDFKGPFVIRAKMSRTGDAITDTGDFLGPEARGVKNGADDLSLTLDEVAE